VFVLFVYHAYIDPAHYQSSQVLCEHLSIQLTDILHKLHTEALNLLHMELYARNKLITETMNEQLFIMVCRHFAYAGTIDKILPFRDEFESIMLETSYYNRPLYQVLHGLLIPFRVGRLRASDHYDPNNPDLIAGDPKRTYLYRLNRMLRHLSLHQQTVQLRYTPTHPFVCQPELFRQSFANDGIYSFSMSLVHNAGPCAPITIPQLREILLHHGYLTCMQIHDQYQELSVILYLLYTHNLIPNSIAGVCSPMVLPNSLPS